MENVLTMLAYGVVVFLIFHGGDLVRSFGRRKCGRVDCACRKAAD